MSGQGLLSDPRLAAGLVRWTAFGRERVTVVARLLFSFRGPHLQLVPSEPMTALPPHVIGDERARVMAASDRAPYVGRAEVTFLGRSSAPAGASARLSVTRGHEMIVDKRVTDATALAPLAPDHASTAGLLRDGDRAGLATDPISIGEGFPWDALQTAPPDQRLTSLQGDETLHLEWLLDGAPHARLTLPGVRVRVRVGAAEPAVRLDRVHVDGEQRLVALTFRAQVPLEGGAPLSQCAIGLAGADADASTGGPWRPPTWLLPRHRAAAKLQSTAGVDEAKASQPATPWREGARPTPRPGAAVHWSALPQPMPANRRQSGTMALDASQLPPVGATPASTPPPRVASAPPPPPALVSLPSTQPSLVSAPVAAATPAQVAVATPAPAPAPAPRKPSLGERFLARKQGRPA
jgi:hypothetical protein